MNDKLTITNQNAKSILSKSTNLLNATNYILTKKSNNNLIKDFINKPILLNTGHSDSINSIAISQDGKYIISGSEDTTIKIWDIKTGECLNTLEDHTGYVNSITISQNGMAVISGSYDQTIKIWYFDSGKCLNTLEEHSGSVNCITISPDGKYIISGSEDGTIKIWDFVSRKCLNTLEEHSDFVNCITISPDGKYIISGSENGTIKIWDFETYKNIYTIHSCCRLAIDLEGFFTASNDAIENFIRIKETPLSQRKLTKEEIEHFRKKDEKRFLGK